MPSCVHSRSKSLAELLPKISFSWLLLKDTLGANLKPHLHMHLAMWAGKPPKAELLRKWSHSEDFPWNYRLCRTGLAAVKKLVTPTPSRRSTIYPWFDMPVIWSREYKAWRRGVLVLGDIFAKTRRSSKFDQSLDERTVYGQWTCAMRHSTQYAL
jgi:hypothetical protein